MSFIYQNQEYDSKAACIRTMFDAGKLTNSPEDKNRIAHILCMTTQTVHATLVKHLANKNPSTPTKSVENSNNYSSTIRLVKDKYKECYTIAGTKGYKLPEIDIRFDLRGSVAGQFCIKDGLKYFRVNLELAKANLKDYLTETVPHEFAHYIQRMKDRFSKPHGDDWKIIMTCVFGLQPERCHDYNLASVPRLKTVTYKCACRTFQIGAVRHRRIVMGLKVFKCRTCHSIIVQV